MKPAIEHLLANWLESRLTAEEEQHLKELIEQGEVDAREWEELKAFARNLPEFPVPDMRGTAGQGFFQALEEEKRTTNSGKDKASTGGLMNRQIYFSLGQLAAALFIFAFGLGMGLWIKSQSASQQQLVAMQRQMQQMQQQLVVNLLEKPQATDRLKAVSMSEELVSKEAVISNALLKVLETDSNVNVRLAALDVLLAYADNPRIRARLIEAIPRQTNPLVQITLAQAMVQLNEKKAVDALKQLLESNNLNEAAEQEVNQSIQTLI